MINIKRGKLIGLIILTLTEVHFRFIYVHMFNHEQYNIIYILKTNCYCPMEQVCKLLWLYRFTYLSFTKQSRPSLFEVISSWTTTYNLKPSIGECFGHFFLSHFGAVLLYLVKKLLSFHLQTVTRFSAWMWRKVVHLCSLWSLAVFCRISLTRGFPFQGVDIKLRTRYFTPSHFRTVISHLVLKKLLPPICA